MIDEVQDFRWHRCWWAWVKKESRSMGTRSPSNLYVNQPISRIVFRLLDQLMRFSHDFSFRILSRDRSMTARPWADSNNREVDDFNKHGSKIIEDAFGMFGLQVRHKGAGAWVNTSIVNYIYMRIYPVEQDAQHTFFFLPSTSFCT